MSCSAYHARIAAAQASDMTQNETKRPSLQVDPALRTAGTLSSRTSRNNELNKLASEPPVKLPVGPRTLLEEPLLHAGIQCGRVAELRRLWPLPHVGRRGQRQGADACSAFVSASETRLLAIEAAPGAGACAGCPAPADAEGDCRRSAVVHPLPSTCNVQRCLRSRVRRVGAMHCDGRVPCMIYHCGALFAASQVQAACSSDSTRVRATPRTRFPLHQPVDQPRVQIGRRPGTLRSCLRRRGRSGSQVQVQAAPQAPLRSSERLTSIRSANQGLALPAQPSARDVIRSAVCHI